MFTLYCLSLRKKSILKNINSSLKIPAHIVVGQKSDLKVMLLFKGKNLIKSKSKRLNST